MNPVIVWTLIGALLGGGLAALIAVYDRSEAQNTIAGDLPLTEDQVRTQLTARGWGDLMLSHDSRYIEITGKALGHATHMTVDSLTGKILNEDSDDD